MHGAPLSLQPLNRDEVGFVTFDIQTFLRQVEPSAINGFLERYGEGQSVDWQQGTTAAANAVLDALHHDGWAISALENCELIAANGGLTSRTAGHRRPELMPGVDNLDVNDETCAVWLATQNREIFEYHIVSAAHALKGLSTRPGTLFRLTGREQVTAAIGDAVRLGEFKVASAHVLKQHKKQVPAYRSLQHRSL